MSVTLVTGMLWYMKVEERFFATLMALNGQLDDVYTHSTLAYEDWSRQTWGGHPHDWQADEVNTTLLFKARTDKGCKGVWAQHLSFPALYSQVEQCVVVQPL